MGLHTGFQTGFQITAAFLVFVSTIMGMLWLYYYLEWKKGRKEFTQRLRGEYDGPSRSGDNITGSLFGMIAAIGKKTGPKEAAELHGIKMKMARAGLRKESHPVVFFGVKAVLAGLALVLSLVFGVFHMGMFSSLSGKLLLGILSAAIGFYLPGIWLNSRIESRKKEITLSFPDALDLLVICVEAGMGLDQAIGRVGEEMKLASPALSDELGLLGLELRAGKPRREALRNLAARVDLDDVYSLVTLIVQTDKFGTGIAPALRVYSDAMRTRRQQRGEEAAAKLPVKLVFPLVFFIFPSLFTTLLGPAAIQIYRNLFHAIKIS